MIEQVRDNSGRDVRVASNLKTTEEPTSEELRIIGEGLDPAHLFT